MKKKTEKKVKISKEEKKRQIAEFVKTHLIKKVKILSIVGLIIFLFVTFVIVYDISKDDTELRIFGKLSLLDNISERVIVLLLILVAGWVPYFYMPAVAFGAYVFMLAGDVSFAMGTKGMISTFFLNTVPTIFDILTVSILTAVGLYMCNYSTKKRKCMQSSSFSFLDVKIQLYQIAKKQAKYDEAVAKKQEKIDKMKKYDVKIDYLNIFRIVPVVIAINIFICMIQYFINN